MTLVFIVGFCIHQHCSQLSFYSILFVALRNPGKHWLWPTLTQTCLPPALCKLFFEKPWAEDPVCSETGTRLLCGRKISTQSLARGREVRGWDGEMVPRDRRWVALPHRSQTPELASQNFPSFICYFHFFSPTTPQKKVQRPIWLTIESMQVWHCAAVRRSFHGEIPQRNSSGGEIGSSAQRVCTKLRGGRKSTKSQRINNNEVLSDSEGEENGSESKLLAHRACPSHGHEGPAMAVCGWRPWDQILRWRLPAWTHGTEEPLTMTLGVGRGGLRGQGRSGPCLRPYKGPTARQPPSNVFLNPESRFGPRSCGWQSRNHLGP